MNCAGALQDNMKDAHEGEKSTTSSRLIAKPKMTAFKFAPRAERIVAPGPLGLVKPCTDSMFGTETDSPTPTAPSAHRKMLNPIEPPWHGPVRPAV